LSTEISTKINFLGLCEFLEYPSGVEVKKNASLAIRAKSSWDLLALDKF
jgi:hypothetical protein